MARPQIHTSKMKLAAKKNQAFNSVVIASSPPRLPKNHSILLSASWRRRDLGMTLMPCGLDAYVLRRNRRHASGDLHECRTALVHLHLDHRTLLANPPPDPSLEQCLVPRAATSVYSAPKTNEKSVIDALSFRLNRRLSDDVYNDPQLSLAGSIWTSRRDRSGRHWLYTAAP